MKYGSRCLGSIGLQLQIQMQSKDAKKSRVGTPVSGHPANKNININISYNITLGRNNKPTLINSLIEGDAKNKKSNAQPQTVKSKPAATKEKLQTEPPVMTKLITQPIEDNKSRLATNHHPLSLINSYLEGKINKTKRRKKNLSNLSRLEKEFRMPTTKMRTQQASTTNISQTKPRRGMSVGRVQTKMYKSGQNSRRNNSDGSKKQLSKEYRKKSGKRKGSWSAVGPKNKTKKVNFKSQDRSPSNEKVQKRRKTEICFRTQQPEQQVAIDKQSLVQKLIRTEITSVGCLNSEQSPIARLPSTQQKTNESWDTRWNQLSNSAFMKPKHNRTKSKHCLTDRLKQQAAVTIQRAWRNYKKRQVLSLYSHVFSRHYPEKKAVTPKFEDRVGQQEAQITIVEQHVQFTQKSEQPSEEFQFNIKKYEDMVSQSINAERNRQATYDSDHEVSVSTDKQKYSSPKQCNPTEEIEYFKAHQLEQWNKINIMISQQMKEGTQYQKLLHELIKHTEMNKRWIEEQASPKESSTKLRYRELAEQPGIFQKLKKKSSSQKKCLEGKIVEEMGCLSSNSSKKCPQVYIDVSGEQAQDKSSKPSQFEKYLNCGFGKLVEGEVPIEKMEKLQNITQIQETLSEGSSPSIDLKPIEPNHDGSWKKICLQNVSKIPSPQVETKNTFYQREQKMEQHNIFMRRQVFTRQAVYESMFQRQINLACQDIVALKCLQGNGQKKKNKRIVASSANTNKGIRTDFSQIKRYILRFIDYMIDECPSEDLSRTIRNINRSLGPSSKQVLQYLSLREPADQSSKSSDDSSEYVISISCFQTYETNSAEAKNNSKNYAYLYYWHQSLFEAFNQCLDQMRPYGVYGQPYVWQIDGRVHRNQTSPQNLRVVMLRAAEKMYSHAAILSGIIFDKEDSPFVEERVLDQTKKQVNEERMSRMLAQMLIEDEPNFINYKDEVVELQIQLSYTIIQAIMRETVMQIYTISRCRQRL